jgi:hypothetical protein
MVPAEGNCDDADASPVQSTGGTMCTMLPHLGQARIWPIASALRTLSRERHVSQVTRNGSTANDAKRG